MSRLRKRKVARTDGRRQRRCEIQIGSSGRKEDCRAERRRLHPLLMAVVAQNGDNRRSGRARPRQKFAHAPDIRRVAKADVGDYRSRYRSDGLPIEQRHRLTSANGAEPVSQFPTAIRAIGNQKCRVVARHRAASALAHRIFRRRRDHDRADQIIAGRSPKIR